MPNSEPQPDITTSINKLLTWLIALNASLERQRVLMRKLTTRVEQLEVVYENFDLKIVAFPLD